MKINVIKHKKAWFFNLSLEKWEQGFLRNVFVLFCGLPQNMRVVQNCAGFITMAVSVSRPRHSIIPVR